jgi:hypothetical protein
VKHAAAETLAILDDLLRQVRKFEELTEKKPGIFYRRSIAFLHFHEDTSGIFADVKVGKAYTRVRVSTIAERRRLIGIVKHSLANLIVK